MTSRLSSNAVRQLTPLIGSMARLIAQGSNLSDEQLEILMEASDIEVTPEVQAEVQRWAKLLLRASGTADENIRQATGEALQQRGLPEATVFLAVATVAEAQAATLPGSELENKDELAASVERLDLGVLEVGQEAVANIEVRGGPGHILSESDQITVEPSEFEGELTRVLVNARPLNSSGTLWTKIKLVTAAQSIEIPVLARWEEPQKPTDAAAEETGTALAPVVLKPAGTQTTPGTTTLPQVKTPSSTTALPKQSVSPRKLPVTPSPKRRSVPSWAWALGGLLIIAIFFWGRGFVGQTPAAPVLSPTIEAGTAIPEISAQEYLLTEAPTPPTSTGTSAPTELLIPTLSVVVQIYADRDWQDSGILVSKGDIVQVEYVAGQWTTFKNYHPYVGPTGNEEIGDPKNSNHPLPSAFPGVLIARIGTDAIREIGSAATFHADTTGSLFFRMNDDLMSDNDGSVQVQVSLSHQE